MYEHTERWHARNPEKVRDIKRRWRRNNPEKQKEASSNWAKRNPEKVAEKAHRRRARVLGNGGSYTIGEWQALCRQYGDKCAVPGCERTDLEPDHVVPISKGGQNDIANIQPLCVHHNRSKSDMTIDYRNKPGLRRWLQTKLFQEEPNG
jgi:5-methylcytosine-specific restriction endonuclease McrA